MKCSKKGMGLLETVLHLLMYYPLLFPLVIVGGIALFLCNPLFALPACLYVLYVVVAGSPTFAELEFWGSVRKWVNTGHVPSDYRQQFPVEGLSNLPPADTPALYTFHPHGLINLTRAMHTLDPSSPLFGRFQNAYHAVHGFFFRIPFVRELMLCGGCIPASRDYLDWAASKGASITLTPGGAREVQYAHDKTSREVWLFRGRKGYIRFAQRHGLPIVPLYTAGEQDVMTYPQGWLSGWGRWIGEKGRLLTGVTTDWNCLFSYSLQNIAKWLFAGADSRPLTVTQVAAPVDTLEGTTDELQERLLLLLLAAREAAPAAFRRRRLSIH
jgi:hypothetical protein